MSDTNTRQPGQSNRAQPTLWEDLRPLLRWSAPWGVAAIAHVAAVVALLLLTWHLVEPEPEREQATAVTVRLRAATPPARPNPVPKPEVPHRANPTPAEPVNPAKQGPIPPKPGDGRPAATDAPKPPGAAAPRRASRHHTPEKTEPIGPPARPQPTPPTPPIEAPAVTVAAVDPPSAASTPQPPVEQNLSTGVQVVHLPEVSYPKLSERLREAGRVVVEVKILRDGSVGAIRLIEDPGYRRLVKAVFRAVQKARFKPATQNGQPIVGSVRLPPFRFKL